MILQREITLDQAVLGCNKLYDDFFTCEFAFYFSNNTVSMGFGCGGAYINLVTGCSRLLLNYFIGELNKRHNDDYYMKKINYKTDERIILPISRETMLELQSLKPCPKCGQPFFKVPERDRLTPIPLNINSYRDRDCSQVVY